MFCVRYGSSRNINGTWYACEILPFLTAPIWMWGLRSNASKKSGSTGMFNSKKSISAYSAVNTPVCVSKTMPTDFLTGFSLQINPASPVSVNKRSIFIQTKSFCSVIFRQVYQIVV